MFFIIPYSLKEFDVTLKESVIANLDTTTNIKTITTKIKYFINLISSLSFKSDVRK